MTILLNSLAAIAYAVAAALKQTQSRTSAVQSAGIKRAQWIGLAALIAWGLHTAALLSDFLGFTPSGARFGWSLALSIMMWSIVAIYALEGNFFKRGADSVSAPASVWWAALAMCVLVLVAPPSRVAAQDMASTAKMLFTGHWVLGLAAYGLFAAAVLHGLWLRSSETALHHANVSPTDVPAGRQGLPLLTLEKLMMRLVWAGFIFLTASELLGVVLGEQLSGKALRFDHKTVLSTLSWFVFAGLLVAHHFFGVRGRRAVKWLMVGSVLLLLGYAGSWFVKEVLLGRA